MESNDAYYHCRYLPPDEIDKLEFVEKVAKETMRILHDPDGNFPIGASRLWGEMSRAERLDFVYACMECFYWVYVRRSRKDPKAYPIWEDANTDQKVSSAAAFCSFILGTESEHDDFEEPDPDNREPSQTDRVN
jgi:hypothetical protein